MVLVAGILGGGLAYATADRSYRSFISEDQTTVRSAVRLDLDPAMWTLVDGPIRPGGEVHRVETWVYRTERARAGSYYYFVDGLLVHEGSITIAPDVTAKTGLSPHLFHRGLGLRDLERLIGERATPLERVDTPYPGSKGYSFARAGILVTILGGRFFTAQTY